MVIKFNDLENWSTETLELSQRWVYNGVNINKVLGSSPKYFMIDWSGVQAEDVNLNNIDKDVLIDYINGGEQVNNKGVLLKMLKHVELPNEEMLWVRLVDDHIISHDLFCKNTYEENFNIWWKTIEHNLK